MESTFFKTIAFAVLIVSFSFNSIAQETKTGTKTKSASQSIQTPKPAPNQNSRQRPIASGLSKVPVPMQNAMHFMGRWTADATLIIDGKTHQVEYHIVGRGSAEGNAVYIEELFTDSVLGNLRGANLIGYDPNDQQIHWYSVDNQGTTHEHTGNWGTPDSLHIEHSSVIKGKNYSEKIDFVFESREELKLKLVATLDGKETKRITGVFHREKQLPKEKPQPTVPDEKK